MRLPARLQIGKKRPRPAHARDTHMNENAYPRRRTRATRTRITMTLQGRRAGTACWLTGAVVRRSAMDTGRGPPNCRKPALERLARHSPFGRYMKAQLRLAGGRRKPGRNGLTLGLSSDRPRECVTLLGQCVGLTDNIREYVNTPSAVCTVQEFRSAISFFYSGHERGSSPTRLAAHQRA